MKGILIYFGIFALGYYLTIHCGSFIQTLGGIILVMLLLYYQPDDFNWNKEETNLEQDCPYLEEDAS